MGKLGLGPNCSNIEPEFREIIELSDIGITQIVTKKKHSIAITK